MTTCLQTMGLSHGYAPGEMVLQDLALLVPEGAIYGFLGPNGAGKTTTLRILLGLIHMQRGAVTIFGRNLRNDRVEILRRIGSLIENPSLYEHLTAEENLRLLQRIRCVHTARIDWALERVGLGHVRRRRAGTFSLGMKQRLGIAAAMLHKPDLLILDEPTNGLDPNGIIEMRELLVALNRDEGTTIVVSSHLLAEIERLATHVGIIHGGRLLFQGTLDELRGAHAQRRSVQLKTRDDAAALAVLAETGIDAALTPDGIRIPPISNARIARVNRHLVERGVEVHAIGPTDDDLESIFMSMIGSLAA